MITLFLKTVLDSLSGYSPYKELVRRISRCEYPCTVQGPRGFFLTTLLTRALQLNKNSILAVLPSEQDAEHFISDLKTLGTEADYFPWWGTVPYVTPPNHEKTAGHRIRILTSLLGGNKQIIVTSLRGFLSPLPPPELLEGLSISLNLGDTIDPVFMEERLADMGYVRVPKVYGPGEFALRGEVLDMYLPGDEYPIRIVFEFDVIEDIKTFETSTQSSLDKIKSCTVYPFKEILWSDEQISRVEEFLHSMKIPAEGDEKTVEDLKTKKSCEFEELYYTLAFDDRYSLIDYLAGDSPVVFVEYERLKNGIDVLSREYTELYKQAARKKIHSFPRPEIINLDFGQEEAKIRNKMVLPSLNDPDDGSRIRFLFDGPKSFFGNIRYLKEEIENYVSNEYKVFIFAESETQAQRIGYLLKEYDVQIIEGTISEGFSLPEQKILCIQENEIFGRKRRVAQSVKKVQSKAIDTFIELNKGDYVVHINYGIGRFSGIERIKAAGTERDYIQLEYAGDETIFIPIEQVNLIQKYIGSEGRAPSLDKLGGKSWDSRKSRVRKSVEDLAEMLIGVYSKRRLARGFSFPRDTDWQIEFEAAFPYDETEDQLKCIQDVKEDMESPSPMDRLICGDVGYGKTEVAMRAAFKAVTGGKQVAFLAPTTILAEQHFENFIERMESYPIKLEMISRFVPRQKQKEILKRLEKGEVDVIIGTHRILQKDIVFNDLGLLIVDEEQRFGVKHKERLKEVKTSVDCLALSATPIPRTLHMSLLKIRDMSLLTTAPYNRHPIETYIREYDEKLLEEAVRNEVNRGGQVYYLHNRVETLPQVRRFIESLAPELIVDIAHGQMNSNQLEDVMHRFIHGGSQVLVATTIIENGIDIPNVNTIVIDRADMYGISQLYQLRGRVGRSGKKAYAYLFYPADKALSELAMKRLRIISDYTDLGAGFKVAMKDMEVRGAGNLLGRQQHGEIASVGFDMYLRILDEAVAELQPEKEEGPPEVYLELDYSGFIPDSYIKEPVEKMEIYKKIASIATDYELVHIQGELIDRFGPLPDEVQSLMSLAEIRIICKKLYVSSLQERKGKVRIEFAKVSVINVDKVLHMMKNSGSSVKLDPHNPNVIMMDTGIVGLREKSEFIRDRLSSLI